MRDETSKAYWQNKVGGLEVEIVSLQATNKRLEGHIIAQEATQADLENEAKTYQARYECALGDIAQYKRSLERRDSQLGSAHDEINDLQGEVATLTAYIGRLEGKD